MKSKKLTKAFLYQDITQQGYILPKQSSTICNLAYLLRVRNGVEYCPLEEEISGMFCPNPPKKMLLLMFIQEELEKNGDSRTLSFDEKHLPDVDWCLKALSSLDPLHQIFEPEYIPPLSHRGRRGKRYVPTAEDLLFIEEEKEHASDEQQKTFTNQGSSNHYTSSQKDESKDQPSKMQSKQPQISKQNPLKKNKEERQTEISESIKSFNIEKDIMDQNNIGPLVQMLKALDDKGLLEECMQHYIEIQTSYDKVNQEKGQAKMQSEGSKKILKTSQFKKKGFYFTQEHGTCGTYSAKEYKQKKIQYDYKKKFNQFTEIQSPANHMAYGDDTALFKSQTSPNKQSKKGANLGDYQSHKTSASSDKMNQIYQEGAQLQHDMFPVKNMEQVKDFGTPEHKSMKGDEGKNCQKDVAMNDENAQLYPMSRQDQMEAAEMIQMSHKDQTPQAVFII